MGDIISERVYVCDSKDMPALKKLLEYDPYLDTSIIPTPVSEKDLKKMPEEDRKKAEEQDRKARESLEKLRSDPDANIIFARQTYQLKDGITMGLDRDKYYLYINASDEFFARAEDKLKKSAPSTVRAPEDVERQIIDALDSERKRSEQGLGSIFG